MYKSTQLPRFAKLFVQEAALGIYQRWGAKAKVQLLQESYPEFFVPTIQRAAVATATSTSTSTSTSTDISSTNTKVGLDLSSIMKAVQTISSNVVLDDDLLRSFIKIVMENAGASRCLLLLEHDDQLALAAKSESAESEIQLLKNQAVNPIEDLCLPLVQYVQHTQEPVVLTNATRDGSYTEDPYVIRSTIHYLFFVYLSSTKAKCLVSYIWKIT